MLKIANSGRVLSTVNIPGNSPEPLKFAAAELQKYIKKVSGYDTRLCIGGEKPGNSGMVLRTETVEGRESPDAFSIKMEKEFLVFTGNTPRAVLYSVYFFLEKYLGIRWLAPGDEGEVIPQKETIELPDNINIIESPAFDYRCKGSVGCLEEIPRNDSLLIIDWLVKNRMNYFLIPIVLYEEMKKAFGEEIEKRGLDFEVGHHNFDYWVPQSEFFEKHPEYFSFFKGARQKAEKFWVKGLAFGTQLCLANKEIVEICASRMIDFLERNPEVKLVDLWPNDNFGVCECPECKKLNGEGKAHLWPDKSKRARSYQLFANKVAAKVKEKFPDLRISIISYVDGIEPGMDVPMEDNIEVMYATYVECYSHAIDNPSCHNNSFYLENIRNWQKLAKRIVLFEYYYKCAWMGTPFPIFSKIAADLKCFREMKVNGLAPQITIRNFKTMGPVYYLFAKLAWNPDLDKDEILKDYFCGYYGKNGLKVMKIFETIEEYLIEAGNKNCPVCAFGKNIPLAIPQPLREKILPLAKALKAGAQKGEEKYRDRLNELETWLKFTDILCKGYESSSEEEALEYLDKAQELADNHPAADYLIITDKEELKELNTFRKAFLAGRDPKTY